MKSLKFAYNHCVAWSHDPSLHEALQPIMGDDFTAIRSYSDAEVVYVEHPFGAHITISAFGGQSIYTVMSTGGHQTHAACVVMCVDGPIEVTAHETLREALAEALAAMPHPHDEKDGVRSLRIAATEAVDLLLNTRQQAMKIYPLPGWGYNPLTQPEFDLPLVIPVAADSKVAAILIEYALAERCGARVNLIASALKLDGGWGYFAADNASGAAKQIFYFVLAGDFPSGLVSALRLRVVKRLKAIVNSATRDGDQRYTVAVRECLAKMGLINTNQSTDEAPTLPQPTKERHQAAKRVRLVMSQDAAARLQDLLERVARERRESANLCALGTYAKHARRAAAAAAKLAGYINQQRLKVK